MKQQRLTVALALLVSPISSWNLDKPTPHQDSNVWNPTGFVADGGKAKSGGRCGIDAQGSACDDGLCCSDWGFCGQGPLYCAVPICQSKYGACETNELPYDDMSDFYKTSLKEPKPSPQAETKPSCRPIVKEVELAPEKSEQVDDLETLKVKPDDIFWALSPNDKDDLDPLESKYDEGKQDLSWEEEITEQPDWEEDFMSQVSRQDGNRPKFGSLPYGIEISSCLRSGTVALTFDDGPNPYLTGELLDLLDERNVKATFFVNGLNQGFLTSPEKSQHVDRMIASGHHVASHGWSHLNLDDSPYETKRSEITQLEDAFVEVVGAIPTYFRPPFGACNGDCLGLLEEYGYHVIRWDVDTNDFRRNLQESMNTVSSAFSSMDSANVLAHDIHDPTVFSLAGFMIDQAEQNGLELVTLGACMNDPPQNWYRDPQTGGPWRAAATKERDESQALHIKHRVDDDQSSAAIVPLSIVSPPVKVNDIATLAAGTSTPTPQTRTNIAKQRASTLHPRKDECTQSHKEIKPTGTVDEKEEEEENKATGRGQRQGFAFVVFAMVGLVLLP